MCEFDARCSGSDGMVGHALGQIAQGKWGATGVLGTGGAPSFTYTTGLTTLGRPELVMTGLDPEIAVGVINLAAVYMLADPDLVDGRDPLRAVEDICEVVAIEASDTSQMHVTRAVYGEFRALQLVWPDERGRFPWDRRYPRRRSRQPLWGRRRASAA